MHTTTTDSRFAIRGTTDDVTTCECCGRSGLRKTVMLHPLDADGNPDGLVYYGTSCAGKAMGIPGKRVADQADAADRDWTAHAERAREWLAVYGPVEHADPRTLADAFFSRNPHMRTRCSARVEVDGLLASAREILAERGLTA